MAICATWGTPVFDFRAPKVLAGEFLADADQQKVKGYDHAFLLQAKGDARQPAAHVWSQDEKATADGVYLGPGAAVLFR